MAVIKQCTIALTDPSSSTISPKAVNKYGRYKTVHDSFNIPVVHTRRLARFRPKQLINRVRMILLPLEKILCARCGRHPRRGPHGPSRGGGGGAGYGGGASYGSFRFRHHLIACVLCVHPSINAIF